MCLKGYSDYCIDSRWNIGRVYIERQSGGYLIEKDAVFINLLIMKTEKK
jgi:hypothetical protein